MDYEQKYKEALERAKDILSYKEVRQEDMEYLFPELKESEEERIRKALIKFHKSTIDIDGIKGEQIVAWLEKQGESYTKRDIDDAFVEGMALAKNELEKQGQQNPPDKFEPKFHEGDWIVQKNIGTYKVVEVCESWYEVIDIEDNHYSIGFDKENMCHLWTIQDAKDGDVLQLGKVTAIFKKYIGQEKCICYCSISGDGDFEIPIKNGEDNVYGCTNTTPATKEQRDLLFQKMNEEGYEWNAELKKVSKITTPADVGFEELGKAWAEEANKQNLANSAKTCKKSQRMISAKAKEALYTKPEDILLNKALDFIVETQEENDYICEKMSEFSDEWDYCWNNCQNLQKECVIRFLKHYEKSK